MKTGRLIRNVTALGLGLLICLAFTAPVWAQGTISVAVIDSDRIVRESTRGKAALSTLKAAQDKHIAEMKVMKSEADALKQRIEEGRLSLSEDRLRTLAKEYEDKGIQLRRYQEDAELDLNKKQAQALQGIEKDVLAIIKKVGDEKGYTLIFSKFNSGLVFATPAVDITDEILQRFDTK